MVEARFNASIRWDFDREPALTRDSTVSPTPPAAFGRFRVVHQVGAGVHGPVFLGTDPDGDRQVAIKTFPLDITPERAASLAAAFDHLVGTPLGHPSIVTLLAAGADGSTVYLVQEYVRAESVDAAVRQYGPAPVPDALRLIGQLAGALDFAAVAGVHHGALHPRDVLVAPNEVRLTGLGVAEAFEQVGLRVTARRPYSAPERREHLAWGTPADVFSLAAVGFEMLTGRRPGSAEALAADTRSIPSPEPAALAEVFARALSPRPDDRFQTALAFAAALRHALTGEPIDRPDVAPLHAAPSRDVGPAILPVAGADDIADGEPAGSGEADTDRPIEAPALPVPEPADLEAGEVEEPLPHTMPEPVARQDVEAEESLPPELAVFAPEPREPEEARRAAQASLSQPEPEPEPGPAGEAVAGDEHDLPSPEPEWGVEAETAAPPASIDEFRSGDEVPEEAPVGPRELGEERESGEEPEARAAAAPLLPLEMEMEPDRPVPPSRPAPPPAPPPPRPVPPPVMPPVMPRDEARLAPRRSRFPLSSLLAMLLLGIVGGFVGGYFVGQGEPAGPGSPSTVAATPSDGDPTLSKVPPTEVARPEPSEPAPADSPAAAPPPGGQPPAAEPPAVNRGAVEPPRPSPRAATKPAPRAAAPANAGTSRQPEPDEPEDRGGRFEAPLSVISRPAGALVRLDGRAVGKTPLRLQAVGAGAHVIRLELTGYLPWTSAIQVVSGNQNRVTASLEPRPGGIE